MVGVVGHTGGLTNPRIWRRRCRAGYSNTGGPPLPQKRAPFSKKARINQNKIHACISNISNITYLLFPIACLPARVNSVLNIAYY